MVVTGAVTVNAVVGGAADEVVTGGVRISIPFFFRKNAALIALFSSARSTSRARARSRNTSVILLITLLSRKDHDSRSDSEHLLLPTVFTAYSPHSFLYPFTRAVLLLL